MNKTKMPVCDDGSTLFILANVRLHLSAETDASAKNERRMTGETGRQMLAVSRRRERTSDRERERERERD